MGISGESELESAPELTTPQGVGIKHDGFDSDLSFERGLAHSQSELLNASLAAQTSDDVPRRPVDLLRSKKSKKPKHVKGPEIVSELSSPSDYHTLKSAGGLSLINSFYAPERDRTSSSFRPRTAPTLLPPLSTDYEKTVSDAFRLSGVEADSPKGWRTQPKSLSFGHTSADQDWPRRKSFEYEDLLQSADSQAHIDGVRCFSKMGETTGGPLSLAQRAVLPLGKTDHVGRKRRLPAKTGKTTTQLAVEVLRRPKLRLDATGHLVTDEEEFLAFTEIEVDTSIRPIQLPALGKYTLSGLRMPMLRLQNLEKDWCEPIRSREKNWRIDSQREALGGVYLGKPAPSSDKMKFGKYTKYNLDSRVMLWSTVDKTMISRERIFCKGLMISSTFCVVTVYGLGTSGRVFADVLTMPRRLEIEAYDPRTSIVHQLQLKVEDLQTIFERRPDLLSAGKKDEMGPALLKMLYFNYYRLEEDNYCDVNKVFIGTKITQKDFDEIKRMDDEGTEIARKRKLNKEPGEYIMNAWQEQELCLDHTREFSAFEDFQAEVMRRRQAEREEAERLRQLWWQTPKRKRGQVLATALMLNGHLCIVSFFEMPDRPNAAILYAYHVDSGTIFKYSLGNQMLARALRLRTMVRTQTEKSFRKKQYQKVADNLELRAHYDDPTRSVLKYGKYFGTPGERLLQLKNIRFWHNPCQQHFKYDRWYIFDEKARHPLHSAFHPEFSKRKKKAYRPLAKPARMVGKGKQLCAGCYKVDGVLGMYVLRLDTNPYLATGDEDVTDFVGGKRTKNLELDFYVPARFRIPKKGNCDAGFTHTLEMTVDDACRIIKFNREIWTAASKYDGEDIASEDVEAAEHAWEQIARKFLSLLKWENVLEKMIESPSGVLRRPALFSVPDSSSKAGASTLCLGLDCIIYRHAHKLPYTAGEPDPKVMWVIVSQEKALLRFLAYDPEHCQTLEADYDPVTAKAMILSIRPISELERTIQIQEILADLFLTVDDDQRESLIFIDSGTVRLNKPVEHEDYSKRVDKMTSESAAKAKNRTKIKGGKKTKAKDARKKKKRR